MANKKKTRKKKSDSLPITSLDEKTVSLEKSSHYKTVFWIFLFVFFLYGNTLNYGYVFDDVPLIQQNRFVNQGFSGIFSIFTHGFLFGYNQQNTQSYRPLMLTSFAIEKLVFGENTKAHHFFNLFFYGLAGVFLFLFLQRILVNTFHLAPLMITMLYLAHPVHTEVVANLKSRDEILCFLFLILSLYTLILWEQNQKRILLLFSFGCYFLSILSKETGIALIGVIPVLLYLVSKKTNWQIILVCLGYGFFSLLYLLLRSLVLDSIGLGEELKLIDNTLVAATNSADHFATAIFILGKYGWLLLFPFQLSYDYSYPQIPIVSFDHWKVILILFLNIILIGWAFFEFYRKRIISFGIFFFFFMMILVSNFFILIGATMAERFLFIPSLGYCFCLVLIAGKIFGLDSQIKKPSTKNYIFFALIGFLLVSFSFKTIIRNGDWRNEKQLFLSGLKTSPKSARVHHHYASFLFRFAENETDPTKKAESYQKSIESYQKSLTLYPEFVSSFIGLGDILYKQKKYERALPFYLKAIKLRPNNTQALNNTGLIFYQKKDYQKAIFYFNKVLEINPKNAYALGNLGAVAQMQSAPQQAIRYYERAIVYEPNYFNAYENLIGLCKALGEHQKAQNYQKKLQQRQNQKK